MKTLTRAEEEIMQILWEIEKGFVKDILEHFEEPRPAYNTVSTIVRILQDKGFVWHKAFGRTHQYYPVVSKEEYKRRFMSRFVKDYFADSYEQMVSFFARDRKLSLKEMEQIMMIMEKEMKKDK